MTIPQRQAYLCGFTADAVADILAKETKLRIGVKRAFKAALAFLGGAPDLESIYKFVLGETSSEAESAKRKVREWLKLAKKELLKLRPSR